MFGYLVGRLAQAMVVIFAMSVIVFVGVYAIGNPIDVMIDPGATAEIRENLIRQYGLDQPLWQQYFTFVGNVFQGDLGAGSGIGHHCGRHWHPRRAICRIPP